MMRPLRALVLILVSLFFTTILLLIIRSEGDATFLDGTYIPSSQLRALFAFQNPASLFIPTATITLTDDNSTSFAARPAAFGPLLPTTGLSGQIWIGSRFEEDSLSTPGVTGRADGELGCSDIPGWFDEGNAFEPLPRMKKGRVSYDDSATYLATQREAELSIEEEPMPDSETLTADDGTDDYLHNCLLQTRPEMPQMESGKSGRESADIQTMQESAEIHGKVVLLSRGGCGFAEKIKWAQRRGATAVIVGDNLRGGPLVRMYARGDTSNITIPSLFTSHMTAHLLVSLIPTDLMMPPRLRIPDHVRPESHVDQNLKPSSAARLDPRTFTQAATEATLAPKFQKSTSDRRRHPSDPKNSNSITESFLKSLGLVSKSMESDPSHKLESAKKGRSRLSWRQVKDFAETEAWKDTKRQVETSSDDGFVIGVHDWRDPDLVGFASSSISSVASSSTYTPPVVASKSTGKPSHLKGGSIIPGSGVYEQIPKGEQAAVSLKGASAANNQAAAVVKSAVSSKGGSSSNGAASRASVDTKTGDQHQTAHKGRPAPVIPHEGLWVTLSPTDLNASPFFNTLFVLVVSPLVTLAAVYAMLLLRSRIRRRRWRAPKSIVERLPVRIYQALASSTRSSSLNASPHRQMPNQHTPLLSGSRHIGGASDGTRCDDTCGTSGVTSSPSAYGSLGPSIEKMETGLSRWRRRYGGKQVECVVCLEEYVDGVSKVMSLPCGHEFHADCITPWLTTRRRTCPICKGDVVRSMRRASDALRAERRPVESEEEIQSQVALSTNDSPSASVPVPQSTLAEDEADAGHDTRRGASSARQSFTPTSWLGRGFQNGFFNLTTRPTPEGEAHRDVEAAPDRDR